MSALAGNRDMRSARQRRVFLPIWLALVLLAWALLWAWSLSPYARYLDHGGWTGPLAALCRTLPGGGWWLPVALAALAWLLMCIAMMLPTTLPLFDVFERITAGRNDQGLLLGWLGAGYLAVWSLFGVLAHGAHEVLLAGVGRLPWLADRAGWIGVATLAGAGAFQFSALKYRWHPAQVTHADDEHQQHQRPAAADAEQTVMGPQPQRLPARPPAAPMSHDKTQGAAALLQAWPP